jgi:thiol-disulfide isomerase/thioredoxin
MLKKPAKRAVNMPGIVGDVWFNTAPLSQEDLEGKVVLADFWTYSCINCLRTLPHLRDWWSKYRDKDFVMIGIHAPEFEFEKDPGNVGGAIEELGVEWPVVLDNDYVNWHNFANHHWPAKYMADREGRIEYEHFGEGSYGKTERKIQELILQDPTMGPLPEITPDENPQCFRATPETYCGYTRGILSNPGGYIYEREAEYKPPRQLREDGIALDGRFMATREYVESEEPGGTLLLSFKATEVNLVLRGVNGHATARVLLDGVEPEAGVLGTDAGSGGTVEVNEPRMYNLLKSDHPLQGVLAFQALDGAYQAYAFTFSGCLTPPGF